jgi:hypothetical protein
MKMVSIFEIEMTRKWRLPHHQISLEAFTTAQRDVEFFTQVVRVALSRDYDTLSEDDIHTQLVETFHDDVVKSRMKSIHEVFVRVYECNIFVFGFWPGLDIADKLWYETKSDFKISKARLVLYSRTPNAPPPTTTMFFAFLTRFWCLWQAIIPAFLSRAAVPVLPVPVAITRYSYGIVWPSLRTTLLGRIDVTSPRKTFVEEEGRVLEVEGTFSSALLKNRDVKGMKALCSNPDTECNLGKAYRFFFH